MFSSLQCREGPSRCWKKKELLSTACHISHITSLELRACALIDAIFRLPFSTLGCGKMMAQRNVTRR